MIREIVGKEIEDISVGFNRLTIFFKDGNYIILRTEGKVLPRLAYDLKIKISGVIDEA